MTLVVKLGSSIVAGADGALRADVLDGVCAQVAELHRGGEEVVLVTSGAIARGRRMLELDERPAAVDELQAASAVGQGSLFRSYEERLGGAGVRAAQVLLTAFDMSERIHYLNARQTLQRLLAWHVVPVINENDTTATDEITFGDNDFLSAQVAIMIEARRLVLLTDQAGLFSADPRLEPGAELVDEVHDTAELDRYEIGSRGSQFGSGGMRSKVVAAQMASGSGIAVTICDGTAEGTLLAAARGERVGTAFTGRDDRAPSFKLWLRWATPAQGRIVVDAGAGTVLRERGSSLLPVGIVAVEGSFAAGDPVEVVDDRGIVGKGIAEHSSEVLQRLLGKRSDEVAEILPGGSAEAIHRDRFVLT
ncbi:MAG TPA: glutamate 5-kinase [Solirubrobacterales bacterium]|nr:glutamate 5-kinase [Solirubrobacterales bacterium]